MIIVTTSLYLLPGSVRAEVWGREDLPLFFHCEPSLCFWNGGESFYIFFLKYSAEGAES